MVVESIISYLQANALEDIVVLESAWVGDSTERAFDVCGYCDLAERYGVRLINLEQDNASVYRIEGLGIRVCDSIKDIDYLINVPVLKAHGQTLLTCALKNLKGLIPHAEKQRFHAIGLKKTIACLSKIVRTHFVIVDGIIGDLTFEEGGSPVQMNRLIAGRDPVAIDAYAATLLGYDPGEIEYIPMAEALGVGSASLRGLSVVALNQPEKVSLDLPDRGAIQSLRRHIQESDACSPCVGGLIYALKRLSDNGSLHRLTDRLKIGQGFKSQGGVGMGIGDCTAGFDCSLGGCPPSAREIKGFIKKFIE